jgi:hypothetical protein
VGAALQDTTTPNKQHHLTETEVSSQAVHLTDIDRILFEMEEFE